MDDLKKLLAIEEIRQLKSRYFRFLDAQDFDAMAQVFCKDATFDCSEGSRTQLAVGTWGGETGPVTHGRDAIMAWIRGAFTDWTSTHHGHGHEITVHSETEAEGIIAMADFIRLRDRSTRLIEATGHYTESCRFEDGAWRIARTKLTRIFNDYY